MASAFSEVTFPSGAARASFAVHPGPLSNFEISLSYRRKGYADRTGNRAREGGHYGYIGRAEREPPILSAEFRGPSRSCAWEDNVSPSRAFRFL